VEGYEGQADSASADDGDFGGLGRHGKTDSVCEDVDVELRICEQSELRLYRHLHVTYVAVVGN